MSEKEERYQPGVTGPQPRFLEAAREALADVGVAKDRVKIESYG